MKKKEKYGFIYLWMDKKYKRFYVGCHWGNEDDGYVCSSKWMTRAYNNRPQDFKKRIIMYSGKEELLDVEEYWLSMIKNEELGKRYYNLRNCKYGIVEHKKETKEKMSKNNCKFWKGKRRSEETKAKMSEAHSGENNHFFGKTHSEEARRKVSEAKKGQIAWNKGLIGFRAGEERKPHSEESKQKMSKSKLGKHYSPSTEFKKGMISWNKGKKGLIVAWNKGKNWSEEHKKKLSEAKKGRSWWNNGIKSSLCYVPPDDTWIKGRI